MVQVQAYHCLHHCTTALFDIVSCWGGRVTLLWKIAGGSLAWPCCAPAGKEINARGKKKSDDDAEEGQQPQGDRGKKFRALKAREAAAKAAATTNGSSNGGVTTQVEQQVKVPDAPPSKME